MIEKIPGENISVYKYREKTAVNDQFVLDEQIKIEQKTPDQSGEIIQNDQLDKLFISPEYQAIKNLTQTAASLNEKVIKYNNEKLDDVRRKVQDGFYLNEEVLTVVADQLLSREIEL